MGHNGANVGGNHSQIAFIFSRLRSEGGRFSALSAKCGTIASLSLIRIEEGQRTHCYVWKLFADVEQQVRPQTTGQLIMVHDP